MVRVVTLTILLSSAFARLAASDSWARCEPCELADAKQKAAAARRQYQAAHPCPSTARKTGPCPGWVLDHFVPLQCGGATTVANLYWQTKQEMAIKDREETVICLPREKEKPARVVKVQNRNTQEVWAALKTNAGAGRTR